MTERVARSSAGYMSEEEKMTLNADVLTATPPENLSDQGLLLSLKNLCKYIEAALN